MIRERLFIRESAVLDGELTTRSIPVRADSFNEDARSVEAVIATESPVQVFDFERFEIIDEVLIAGGRATRTEAVLLESHDRSTTESVWGSVRDIHTEGNEAVGTIVFAKLKGKEGERVDNAMSKVKDRHITDVSVGYRVDGFVDIKPGATETVKGRTFTARERTLRITTNWTLREVSLVPIGADEAAKIRQAAGHRRAAKELQTMNEKQRKYLESIGLRADTDDAGALAFLERLGGEQREAADKLGDGTTDPAGVTRTVNTDPAVMTFNTPAPEPVDVGKIVEEKLREEHKRMAAIRALAGDDIPQQMVDQAIDERWTTERAAPVFLEYIRDNRAPALAAGPSIICKDHNRDCTRLAMTDALSMRCGVDLVSKAKTDDERAALTKRSELASPWAGYSMVEMCRQGLRIAGISEPHSREEMIHRAVSTGSMTNIFSGVVNLKLLAAYDESPDTTGPFTTEVEVPDFKTNERPFLGKTGFLERLPRGDSAKHVTRSDTKEEYKLAAYAGQFVIDRQDIVDDSLNALMTMPVQMGQAAANLRPDLVYSIILANAALGADSIALFDVSTHGNFTSGSGNLAKATLVTALTAMATQQQDGKNLGLFGKNILVPHAQKFTGKELIRSQTNIVLGLASTSAATLGGDFNSLSDEGLGIIADSRLDNGVIDPATGTSHSGSSTTWYVVASGGRHTIEVGFLAGSGRRPQMRSFVLTEGRWGVGWDVYHDIGAKALDYRGFYKSTA